MSGSGSPLPPGPLGTLRGLAYHVAFALWTAFAGVLFLPVLVATRRLPPRVARIWAGVMPPLLRLTCGIRHEVRGLDTLPERPFLVAAKHQSAWETLALFLLLDNPAFVLKRELLSIPVFGAYLRRSAMIPIDRKAGAGALRGMVAAAQAAAAEKRPIVIFPEGTRLAPGDKRRYHPGVTGLYQRLGLPVVPVALNSGLHWPRHGLGKRPGRIVLEFLPAIPPGLERRAFEGALRDRIESGCAALARPSPTDDNPCGT